MILAKLAGDTVDSIDIRLFDVISILFRSLVISTLLFLLAACQNPAARFSGQTMGTSYSVVISDDIDQQALVILQRKVEQTLDEINTAMSTYLPDSEISRFNRFYSSDWHPVSPSLAEVVETAQTVSRLSDGAFDITVAPLVNLWGFGPGLPPTALPAEAEINQALKNVGYSHLSVRKVPPALKKSLAALSIDLSAIAKGYAVDQIAAVLQNEQIQNFLVEIGGELYGSGTNKKGRNWRIGIERPDDSVQRAVIGVVQLDSRAIATSGDYKNYLELDGKHYSHEINSQTGYPVTHTTVSVSVVADNVMLADAWATALLVMGSHRGMILARDVGLAAYFIDRQGTDFQAVWSDNFADLLIAQ